MFTDREIRQLEMMVNRRTITWHSMSCVCEPCLDADHVIYKLRGSVQSNINTEGLSK